MRKNKDGGDLEEKLDRIFLLLHDALHRCHTYRQNPRYFKESPYDVCLTEYQDRMQQARGILNELRSGEVVSYVQGLLNILQNECKECPYLLPMERYLADLHMKQVGN